MMTTLYDPAVTMNPDARAPDPHMPAGVAESYLDADYLARTDPLTMLMVNDNMRAALRRYDEACVHAARQAGATWAEVGDALGMERQNAQRKYSHLPSPPR